MVRKGSYVKHKDKVGVALHTGHDTADVVFASGETAVIPIDECDVIEGFTAYAQVSGLLNALDVFSMGSFSN